jgi:acetyl-CoA C-acetyltransferase
VTTIDPRTPVIVAAAQINDRGYGCEPLDLMVRCVEAALVDSGQTEALRRRIGSVRVVWGIWPYKDPGRLVAARIGAPDARSTITTSGGNQVYDLVIDTAKRIQSGEMDTAVICGAESLRTRRSDRARGTTTEYVGEREGAVPDELLGKDREMFNDVENEIGVNVVARFYAMAETALRHRLGEDLDTHRARIASLWSRASVVAAANPNAWSRTPLDAATIATESESNRPVASPYPKLMTSNLDVDQGGAVVMCSVAAAEAAGIARDRWVFPWSGVGVADEWYATNRWAFDESPGMRVSGTRTLELAGLTHDDCELIDLYSCFPVAVQVAQRELAIDPARDFTITGGLTFAAGPLNCYCILPLTRAVSLLRESPDQRAFLTGNGGVFTKHSALVLSAEPPANGFMTTDAQAEVDALPSRPSPTSPVGDARLETYTVTFDREMRPERAIMACLDDSGRRQWAESSDGATMAELLAADCCDRPVTIDDRQAKLG